MPADPGIADPTPLDVIGTSGAVDGLADPTPLDVTGTSGAVDGLADPLDTWNAAPTINGETPVGASELANVAVGYDCDDDAALPAGGLALTLTPPVGPAVPALVAGAWQPGYGGTITAVGNGFEVRCTTHPLFAAGAWQATASVTDAGGLTTNSTWGWTVIDAAPTIFDQTPTGASEVRTVAVGYTCNDDVQVDLATLSLNLMHPTVGSFYVLQAGAWRPGFGGTITPASHGAIVRLTAHADFPDGLWTAVAECDDTGGQHATLTWTFTVGVPPTISNNSPTGAAELANVAVGFDCDDDAALPAGGLALTLTPPVGPAVPALVAGAWQPGYGGTITAVGNGFEVRCTTHPLFAAGAWQATASVTDAGGLVTTSTWGWTVAFVPPTINGETPTGAAELANVDVGFDCDDDADLPLAGLALTLTPPVGPPVPVLVAGAWQPGYSGTITSSGAHGWSVVLDTHPLFAAGAWSSTASVTDAGGLTTNSTWGWTAVHVAPTCPRTVPAADDLTTQRPHLFVRVADTIGFDLATLAITLRCATESRALVAGGAIVAANARGAVLANASHGYDAELDLLADLPDRRWGLEVTGANTCGVPLP